MSSITQTNRNKAVPSKTNPKKSISFSKYEQMYLIVNKENEVLGHSQLSISLTEMSIGYSNVAADRTFWDKLHLFQQVFHFCGSQVLRINITIMEFSFWLPAIHKQPVQYTACIDLASK